MDIEWYYGFVFQDPKTGHLKDYLTEDEMSAALKLAKVDNSEAKMLMQSWFVSNMIVIVTYDNGKLFFRSVVCPKILQA